MPLKAMIRGFSFAVLPISWTNRAMGFSKLNIKEMGSRYLFIVLYLWLEKHLSRGDYLRKPRTAAGEDPRPAQRLSPHVQSHPCDRRSGGSSVPISPSRWPVRSKACTSPRLTI